MICVYVYMHGQVMALSQCLTDTSEAKSLVINE